MSSSSSPCAACKFLRRKCTTDCVFSPYFPADNPKRFADVHKVFGASNVAKILNDIDISHREDAVQSLAYEANARIEDPVYGCVGQISHMQKTVSNLHMRLEEGKKELASLVGPTAMFQMLQDPVPRAHYNIMAASSTMLGLDRQQQYRLQQEQYHRQQQQQQQIGAHIMHQWMQQSERQQQHLQMTLQQPHQQGGDSGGGGGQLVIRERQQHKEQLLERQMQVREQQNQVHGGQVVIRDATAQLQQINSQEQDQLVVALQVKEEQEMFRSVEEMHQQAQMEVIRQQREVELMRLQEQQFRHMEARGRGRGGGGGEGPSGTAELSPLLALGTGFNAMNPYHVQQQEQQQQEEIHDIQLFSDPNLHPPEPENGG